METIDKLQAPNPKSQLTNQSRDFPVTVRRERDGKGTSSSKRAVAGGIQPQLQKSLHLGFGV